MGGTPPKCSNIFDKSVLLFMISSVLYLEHILTVKTNVACKMKVSLVFGSNGALELNENEEAFVLCGHVQKFILFMSN